MTKLILSTSNIVGGNPAIARRSASSQKSNLEFTSALRANFSRSQEIASALTLSETAKEPQSRGSKSSSALPISAWTTRTTDTTYVPSLELSSSQSNGSNGSPGLAEPRSQYEITAKLFFLPPTPASDRCAQTREAIDLVLKQLQVKDVDLLIVSYPGIAFDADDEGDSAHIEEGGAEREQEAPETATGIPRTSDTPTSTSPALSPSLNSMLETYRCLESLHDNHILHRLGVSEFGTSRLSSFLELTRVRPAVDQINVRDCCVVPKPLIQFAREQGVELLTHSDCSEILTRSGVKALLEGVEGGDVGLELGSKVLEPQWVIKYTAVVKDRGVIENKGYFACVQIE